MIKNLVAQARMATLRLLLVYAAMVVMLSLIHISEPTRPY